MKLKFNKNIKKTKLVKCGLLLSLAAIPITLTACGGVSQKLINDSYLVEKSGDAFTSNFSLSQIANDSLKSSTGFQGYFEGVVDEILYNWLVTLSQRNEEYKVLLENEQTNINKEYEDSVKEYKDLYGNDWELKFQQEVLDPAGGTKKNYLQKKLNSFARSTFTNKLFTTLYLSVYNTKTLSVDYNPTEENILSALKSTAKLSNGTSNDYKFKFDNRIDLLSSTNKRPDAEFASFQDFIFQKYAEYENPYIVDFAQWNYSTPSDSLGINSLYQTGEINDNQNSEGEAQENSPSTDVTTNNNKTSLKRNINFFDDTTSTNEGEKESDSTSSSGGSYIFPYFGNENATNTSDGTITKFINFLTGSKTTNNGTEIKNYESDSGTGIKTIPVVTSDNTSTLKFVKNSSLFSDESAEFASAVVYIYGKTTSQLTDINSSISHDIDITSTTTDGSNGLDLISKNFVSTTNLYTTNTTGSTPSIATLQLSTDYLKNVINKDGNLKGLLSSNAYVIDNFVPKKVKIDSSNEYDNSLDKFIFFRAQDGVYATSLDGDTLIKAGSTIQQKKLNSALVVLYRYLLNKYTDQNFAIDLLTELSSFFNSNINWLIYQFASLSTHTGIDGTNFNQTMFNLNQLNTNQSNKILANAISNYLPAAQYFNNSYTAAEKMYETKKKYNQNYGYSVYNNGLASNFNYNYASEDKANYYSVNPNFFYENAMLASTSINPFETNNSNSVNSNSKNGTNSLYKTLIDAIANVTNSLVVQPAEFNKYSQYLYTTNNYVNYGLNATLSESGFVSSLVKNSIYEKYIGDFFSISNYSFSLKNNPFNLANTQDNTSVTDLEKYLKNAMDNFFFMPNFQSETNSLFSYGSTTNTKTTTASKDDTLTSLRKYSVDLWNKQNESEYSVQVSNFNALYSYVAVVKYFMEDNFANFLKYMKDYLANNLAFVVWQNSSNTILNNTTTTLTSQSLISPTKIFTNLNNSTYGSYYGKAITNVGNNSSTTSTNNSTALTNNVISDTFYQTSLNSNYFIATGTSNNSSATNNIGFMGLQTSQINNLSSEVADALFNKTYNNNINLQGCLYGYANDKEALKQIVNNVTNFEFLSSLAGNLDSLTNYQYAFYESINDNYLKLNDKKNKLITIIDTLPSEYFTKFDGYVGESTTDSGATTVNAYSGVDSSINKYGTLAYQLNYSDFSSLASLQKALGAKDSDQNSYKFANEIICNLLVQFATQNPQTFLSQIVGKNKIEVYDIRAHNAFSENGLIWISNWKTTN